MPGGMRSGGTYRACEVLFRNGLQCTAACQVPGSAASAIRQELLLWLFIYRVPRPCSPSHCCASCFSRTPLSFTRSMVPFGSVNA